ncbi:MAG TPA: CDP-archaeol synthase [Methylococcus sp.]|nr:CDP-archaeol synthase [Methylococcus sp.]
MITRIPRLIDMGPEAVHITAQIMILLLAANGTPVLLERISGDRFQHPLDGGCRFRDGRPWFGPSKTWRGFVGGVLAATAVAPWVGLPWSVGLSIGTVSLLGDLASSFLKRRLGIPPSGMALGLDQIPEVLFPLLWIRESFHLTWSYIAWATLLFLVAELGLSAVLYRLHIRKRPY